MKQIIKKYALSLILFGLITPLFAITNITTQSYSKDKWGTYIPSVFYNEFDTTLNFEKAKNTFIDGYHDVLYIREDGIYSDAKFHDGYKVEPYKYKDFVFIENTSGNYVLDDKGFLYKKISSTPSQIEYYNYVFDSLFSTISDLDYVSIYEEDGLKILGLNNEPYELILDTLFFKGEDVDFYLRKVGKGIYGVKLSGIGAIIYETKFDDPNCYITDNVFMTLPLFSYKPLCKLNEMSDAELRLYRNLQFAYHGHTFKSNDLKEIFKHFYWYTPVESNKESSLTKREEKIVNNIISLERRRELGWE